MSNHIVLNADKIGRIVKYRNQGLSADEIGQLIRVSGKTVQNFLNGKHPMRDLITQFRKNKVDYFDKAVMENLLCSGIVREEIMKRVSEGTVATKELSYMMDVFNRGAGIAHDKTLDLSAAGDGFDWGEFEITMNKVEHLSERIIELKKSATGTFEEQKTIGDAGADGEAGADPAPPATDNPE